MTNHFYVIDPQGKAHTRSSKGRTYTHTVLFRRGSIIEAAALAQALKYAAERAPKSYDFDMSMIDGRWQADTEKRHPGLYSQAHWDAEKAKYTKILNGRTVEQFTADEVERARTRHAKHVADGHFSQWHSAGWCGRPDLAQKLLAQQGVEAMILEARVGKPPKPAKKGGA